MARVRLIVVAALAAAACGRADAQAPVASGLVAPAGWSALPELVEPVREAATAAGGVTIEAVEAWGEPARGCYAFWIALRGEGASAAAVIAGIQQQPGIVATDVVVPQGGQGVASLTFTRPPYRGRVRASATPGWVAALACFANEREPALCETGCTQLLGGLK